MFFPNFSNKTKTRGYMVLTALIWVFNQQDVEIILKKVPKQLNDKNSNVASNNKVIVMQPKREVAFAA